MIFMIRVIIDIVISITLLIVIFQGYRSVMLDYIEDNEIYR